MKILLFISWEIKARFDRMFFTERFLENHMTPKLTIGNNLPLHRYTIKQSINIDLLLLNNQIRLSILFHDCWISQWFSFMFYCLLLLHTATRAAMITAGSPTSREVAPLHWSVEQHVVFNATVALIVISDSDAAELLHRTGFRQPLVLKRKLVTSKREWKKKSEKGNVMNWEIPVH